MDGSSIHGSSPPKPQRWAAMHRKTKSDVVWSGPRTKMPAVPAKESNKVALGGDDDNNSLRTDRMGAISCDNMSNKSAGKGLLQDFDLPNFEHPCACSPDGKTPRKSRSSRKTSSSHQESPDRHSHAKKQSIVKGYKLPHSVEIAAGISILPLPTKASKDKSCRNNDSSIDTIDLEDMYQEAIKADIERKKQEKSEVKDNSSSKQGEKNSGRLFPYALHSPTVANGMMEESFILHAYENMDENPEHMAQFEQEQEMIELAMQRSMQDSQTIMIATTRTGSPERGSSTRQSRRQESATAPSTTASTRPKITTESLDTSRREGETEEERLDRLEREMLELALQQSRSNCHIQFQ